MGAAVMSSPREPKNRGGPAQASRADRPAASPVRAAKPLALAPGLYVVSTPIGRLRDVTLHALDVLASAEAVLCEDTRVTRRLCDAHGVRAQLQRYDDHTGARVRPAILDRLEAGAAIALVSDAGTPLVSDPGYKLVSEAAARGIEVFAAPGPSALLAALTVSGLPTDRFLFAGFPPAKPGARRTALAELADAPATLIFYESGPRLAESLAAMAETLGDRPACVARELTKMHEEARRASLSELAAAYASAEPPRGEIVVLVGPPERRAAWSDAEVDAALAGRLDEAPLKTLAAEVAAEAGRPKREVYARAVALKSAPKSSEGEA